MPRNHRTRNTCLVFGRNARQLEQLDRQATNERNHGDGTTAVCGKGAWPKRGRPPPHKGLPRVTLSQRNQPTGYSRDARPSATVTARANSKRSIGVTPPSGRFSPAPRQPSSAPLKAERHAQPSRGRRASTIQKALLAPRSPAPLVRRWISCRVFSCSLPVKACRSDNIHCAYHSRFFTRPSCPK